MPEIDHKAPGLAAAAPIPKDLLHDLDARIAAALAKQQADAKTAKIEAAKPPKIDWAAMTEQDAYNPALNIPVIDHDIPDYMNVMLMDQEYVPVWANKDQRRLGALLAEGYELLKKEHVHPQFKVPLVWSSEGTYEYADVVCLRVHKSLLYGKRRRALELSQQQLKNTNKIPRQKLKGVFELSEEIENPLDPGMNLYNAGV